MAPLTKSGIGWTEIISKNESPLFDFLKELNGLDGILTVTTEIEKCFVIAPKLTRTGYRQVMHFLNIASRSFLDRTVGEKEEFAPIIAKLNNQTPFVGIIISKESPEIHFILRKGNKLTGESIGVITLKEYALNVSSLDSLDKDHPTLGQFGVIYRSEFRDLESNITKWVLGVRDGL